MKQIILFYFLFNVCLANAQSFSSGLYFAEYTSMDSVLINDVFLKKAYKVAFNNPIMIEWEKLNIFSVNNENTEFYAYFTFPPGKDSLGNYFLMLNDTVYAYGGSGKGEHEYHVHFFLDKFRALQLGSIFNADVKFREHPGHRLEINFETEKKTYKPGETVKVISVFNNSGNEVMYNKGGAYRNATGRCDNFEFKALLNGDTLPDCCGSMCFGGIFTYAPLISGEPDTIRQCLSHWINFDRPGIYEVTGSYQFDLHPVKRESDYPDNAHQVWVEKVSAVFRVFIEQ